MQRGALAQKQSSKTTVVGFPKHRESEKLKGNEEAQEHSHLKEEKNSPEAAKSEIDFCSLIDTEFKKETVKTLKELRVNMKEFRAEPGIAL